MHMPCTCHAHATCMLCTCLRQPQREPLLPRCRARPLEAADGPRARQAGEGACRLEVRPVPIGRTLELLRVARGVPRTCVRHGRGGGGQCAAAGYQSYGSRPMGTHSLCNTRRSTRSYTECTSCTQRGTTARPASSYGAAGYPCIPCASPTERSPRQSCRTRQSCSHQHLQSYRNDPDELARGTRWA